MDQPDDKTCPSCAEKVRAKATVCRFCQYDFAQPRPANMPTQQLADDQTKRLKIVGLILALFALLWMVSCALSGYPTGEYARVDSSNDANSLVTPTPPSPSQARGVTIGELWDAYEANEAAAQAEYGDQMLAVTGTVQEIDLDLFDDPIVTLADGGRTINTYFDKDVGGPATASLVKGEKTTIACTSLRETLGRPNMHDCQIANVINSDEAATGQMIRQGDLMTGKAQ